MTYDSWKLATPPEYEIDDARSDASEELADELDGGDPLSEEIRKSYGFNELSWYYNPAGEFMVIDVRHRGQDLRVAISTADLARARAPSDILWSRLDWASWKLTGIWPHRPDVDKLCHLLPEPFRGALLR